MRALPALLLLLAVAGCQRPVAVPTARELIGNRQLLSQWRAKCETGEYSRLPAAEKSNLCSTTHDAVISIAEAEAARAGADFYGANIRRK